MTREDAKKILGEGATDDQITAMLDAFHAQKSELEKANAEMNKYKSDLESAQKQSNSYKVELDKINTANLTKEEQLAKREKELAEKEQQTNLIYNRAKVKEKFASLNLDSATLESLVDSITTGDEAKSLANADIYINSFNSMRESTIKSTKEELINADVKPVASNNTESNVMTWDKFKALSQEEQTKFQKEHPTEFANL